MDDVYHVRVTEGKHVHRGLLFMDIDWTNTASHPRYRHSALGRRRGDASRQGQKQPDKEETTTSQIKLRYALGWPVLFLHS